MTSILKQTDHAEVYERYKEEVRQYREVRRMGGNNIGNEFKANFLRILFQNYFQILPKTEEGTKADCKICGSILKYNTNFQNLCCHLKVSKIGRFL